MSEFSYSSSIETDCLPDDSIVILDRSNSDERNGETDHLCRLCKTKLMLNESIDHTSLDCLNQRCEH